MREHNQRGLGGKGEKRAKGELKSTKRWETVTNGCEWLEMVGIARESGHQIKGRRKAKVIQFKYFSIAMLTLLICEPSLTLD